MIGKIGVTFEENDDAEALSVNTCGKQLTLSASIFEEEVFVAAMLAVIEEITFTMPWKKLISESILALTVIWIVDLWV